ncbi:MAG TPA: permease prefix domain 1-containing protein [Chthonomonadaceae bacterium]|nr:permease prefix domain 1-containing protein [Chthonomonadaceae bacterium]
MGSIPAPPPEATFVQTQVEGYLEAIFRPLAAVMPAEAQAEPKKEMRAHLEALIAAYQEIGASPEQAVQAALRQLGDARQVSRQWKREWERATFQESTRAATRTALSIFGGLTLFSGIMLFLTGQLINYDFGGGLLLGLDLWLPLVAGAGVGLLAKERPVRGTVHAMGLLFFPILLIYGAWTLTQTFTYPWQAILTFGGFQFVGWTLAGCTAAGFCGFLRRHYIRRRGRLAPG